MGKISHLGVFGRENYHTSQKKKKVEVTFLSLANFHAYHAFSQAYPQVLWLLKTQSEMKLKNKIIRTKGEELSSYSFKPYLLFQVWDTKLWSMWTRKKEGKIYKWTIKKVLFSNQPSTSITCCFWNRTWKVTALILLIWLNLKFDKIPSNKLISMVLENKNRGKGKKNDSI